MPARRRISGEHLANLCGQRGRVDRLGQDAQPRALERRLRSKRRPDRTQKRRPGTDVADVGQGLRPIGIVEAENRRLRKHVRGAKAARVQRVAFDLRRAPFVALDEQANRRPAQRHRGREKQRPARDQLFRLTDVRNDLLERLACAGRDARERHRCAHQLEELPPRDRIGNGLDFRRKLVAETLLK